MEGTRVTRSALAVRLLAEFSVIVAGVLVALAVDAALGVRSERQQEEAYYRALVRDLEADTAEYAIALRMTGRSLETAKHVRAVILGGAVTAPRPLPQSLHYASWVNYPDWSSGTMEELYSAGTIRFIRDESVKDAMHSYRALISEWRPRMQGPEYSAFQEYRRLTAGLSSLEAAMAYERTSLGDESVQGVTVDEAALADKLQGNVVLLRTTERMILEWASLMVFYDEQAREAVRLLGLLKERVTRGPS